MEPMNNETELVRYAASGDATAFAALFRLYKDKLYGFLLKATGAPEMAEDIIQDIFLRLWKNREKLPEITHFEGYIYQAARNQVINSLKRMARETLILDELVKTREAGRTDAEDRLNVHEMNKNLHSALEKLTPRQKLVYTLSRDKGLKHEEIARFLDISPSTVNNHLIEALRLIRQQLAARPEAFTILIFCFLENFF
ncbi:RNA polymerase sigma factor [Chitinophaga sp. GCM10012297]|uniref:RNA polymerase sigma-70 factor n=1 Tax=Chitinophaga chungangae TaxID=2821488 RepID=A0ABS3Y9A5_9BACT|nr:RNA polymerase sigma-70 factor [Chitinophaga chungangae]MBO9151250.1 RNA polymerase sigma-70 factor [Chitinophaga chungangae]